MTYSDEQLEAVQHVVERVAANWDGATKQTVDEALQSGLAAADVELDGDDTRALVEAMEANRGTVDVRSVLAR